MQSFKPVNELRRFQVQNKKGVNHWLDFQFDYYEGARFKLKSNAWPAQDKYKLDKMCCGPSSVNAVKPSILEDKIVLNVMLFALPSELQGCGLGRFIWSQYLDMVPFKISHKIYIKGELVADDENSPDNKARRDQLWRDLIGFPECSESVFVERGDKEKGCFFGQLRSVWNPYKSKLRIKEVERLSFI